MRRRLGALAGSCLAAAAITACGSSGATGHAASSNPSTLLRQTFAASHSVHSGVLDVRLVVDPRGSSELSTPLSLSLSGPFDNRGGGRPPESAFTIAYHGLGRTGTFGVTTTATGAYVGLDGTYYQLPSADFKRLQSAFSAHTSTGGAPGLSSLGVDPATWVSHPEIVGTQTVDGVVTEHVHAAVDVSAFVQSLNTILAKESSTLHAAGRAPTHISSAEAAKIASAIRNPSLDVWSGRNDSILRRLQVHADVPVHGSMSTQLGGLTSAGLTLTIDYSHLGAPQKISAPSHVHSFTELQSRLQSLGSGLAGIGSSGLGSTQSGAGGSTASTAAVTKYSRCITRARGDVTKMQRCAKLLTQH